MPVKFLLGRLVALDPGCDPAQRAAKLKVVGCWKVEGAQLAHLDPFVPFQPQEQHVAAGPPVTGCRHGIPFGIYSLKIGA